MHSFLCELWIVCKHHFYAPLLSQSHHEIYPTVILKWSPRGSPDKCTVVYLHYYFIVFKEIQTVGISRLFSFIGGGCWRTLINSHINLQKSLRDLLSVGSRDSNSFNCIVKQSRVDLFPSTFSLFASGQSTQFNLFFFFPKSSRKLYPSQHRYCRLLLFVVF